MHSLLNLLTHQHNHKSTFNELMTSGDIFFTPPAYVCDIQKTFSAEHEAAYKAKENIPFRKTLDGLVVKSQLSCDQADALCTVNKFFEKVGVGMIPRRISF